MEIAELYDRFLQCDGVTIDSRVCPENGMFIALKGKSFDGNSFALQALAEGCRYAVVDDIRYATRPEIILVDDCLQALQALANFHRRRLAIPVIGITGTNGKTTTKELVAAVLQQQYKVAYTQGNLNNQIGVPLTLLRLTKEHQLAVGDMGASHPGEISGLVHIAEPDYGIITNVGKAHLLGFGSLEGVIRTKGELYDYLRTKENSVVFLQNENPYLTAMADRLQCVRYGQSDGLYVSGKVSACSPYLSLNWTHALQSHEVRTHLIGAYNIDNVLTAIAVGCYFHITPSSINEALEAYVPQNSRSQLASTLSNTLIVDAYNANPTSMRVALDNFRLMEVAPKMVVLGDMKELGEASLSEHQSIVDFLQTCAFDCVWLVGPEFAATRHPYRSFGSVEEVKAEIASHKPAGFYILIKGSNSMKMNQLPDLL